METANTRIPIVELLKRRDIIHIEDRELRFNDSIFYIDVIAQITQRATINVRYDDEYTCDDNPEFRVAYVIDSVTRRDITPVFLTRDGEAAIRSLVMSHLDDMEYDAMNSGQDNTAYMIDDTNDYAETVYDSWRDEL